MQILNPQQTAAALPYAALVPAIALVATQLRRGQINAPERMVVEIDPASVLLCMPAIGADVGVTKLITVHADNAHHKLPAIQGEVVVFDTATGRRLALLDGPVVSARRTAAVTLLGIQRLLPRKPLSALLIGTGVQAAAHADALVDYFGLDTFLIASRTMPKSLAKAEVFCAALRRRYPHVSAQAIIVDSLANTVPFTDVVIALTTSRSAVIPAQISSDTLAIGVGAFKPDMAEFPAELLHARAIVVDHLAGAKHEAGDLLQANIDWSTVHELSGILEHPWLPSAQLPVYKTVGHAAWDLAAARVAIASLAK
ncbi:delta(1)-pyrroline-2-carboxylate reductase family protein [Glaciimonas immobilis]|uniref:1-piperideine-2-carboxylate/1-pyrroline-2-carboxylate reductase [NAD(P)H] n=1 Tax=Glaciimonas immobilis TaxID=728004 RepID=A0A840RSI3_9BURK|nr:delta(1)-pyrroline-2-carboxylate reductase family protein [Glaciimonas immobilis]KAF3997811.1 delta(1)-pyrroline-2-carboxylate reductase family protein [Glaciimonas immobilis]MBB5199561.1 1-piperideine-2-carboxylate/1-pyrroline-2-carboxylate reductase [NAD(P)H] [Glaciimonas immobilis]